VRTLSRVENDFDELFSSSVRLVNTNLVDLTPRTEGTEDGTCLQPSSVAMRINTSHESIDVNDFHLTDELLCRALRDAFSTLHPPESVDDTSVLHWRKTLPFIPSNESLKSLTISFNGDALDRHVSTLCFNTFTIWKAMPPWSLSSSRAVTLDPTLIAPLLKVSNRVPH
jgi:hypothetical protein